MTIDSGWVAVGVTIFIALLTLAYGLGALWQRVNGHDNEFKKAAQLVETNRKENKEEHNAILGRIDMLIENTLKDKNGN